MNLLLATHVVLWAAGAPNRPSEAARTLLLDEANVLFFSSASLWEIVIKRELGREDFTVDPVRLRRLPVTNGHREISITSDHALAVALLPTLHRDPFDRVLIAQARVEGMRLLTADDQVARYGEGILLA